MTAAELFDLCMDAIDRFNRGELLAEKPVVMLSIHRPTCPRGRTVRLFGRSGPAGEIACVHDRKVHFEVVAYFPAVPIIQALGEEMGVKVIVRRKSMR